MKKYSIHIIWGVAVVLALAGGFFWGKASMPTRGSGAFAGAASGVRAFGGVRGSGGGFVTGQISWSGKKEDPVFFPEDYKFVPPCKAVAA